MTDNPMPQYDRPPVVETAIGICFDPQRSLSTSVLAGFVSTLGADWEQVHDLPPLPSMRQRGSRTTWPLGEVQIAVGEPDGFVRLQAVRNDGQRVVQVQNGWFIYNWRHVDRSSEYPSYGRVRAAFDEHRQSFSAYLRKHAGATLNLIGWELTYVNWIHSGQLWRDLSDWSTVFPALSGQLHFTSIDPVHDYASRAASKLRGAPGVLHQTLEPRTVPAVDGSGAESLAAQYRLTARGPISGNDEDGLHTGLDAAHEAIVRTFTESTSTLAHEAWGRQV